MYALNYVKAKSVKEAAAYLAKNPEAKLLAGGMTLIPTLKARLAHPTHVVDIAGLPELRGIAVRGGKLAIGAGSKHHDVATSSVVRKAIPALAGLAAEIGDPQVRNRGTLGGALANNAPAADSPAAVLGLGAPVVTTARRDSTSVSSPPSNSRATVASFPAAETSIVEANVACGHDRTAERIWPTWLLSSSTDCFPISTRSGFSASTTFASTFPTASESRSVPASTSTRSEEHTSELQSLA